MPCAPPANDSTVSLLCLTLMTDTKFRVFDKSPSVAFLVRRDFYVCVISKFRPMQTISICLFYNPSRNSVPWFHLAPVTLSLFCQANLPTHALLVTQQQSSSTFCNNRQHVCRVVSFRHDHSGLLFCQVCHEEGPRILSSATDKCLDFIAWPDVAATMNLNSYRTDHSLRVYTIITQFSPLNISVYGDSQGAWSCSKT
ncbi:hypothetical protein CY34DRAFT_406072 [Suillus luteus UH-Slu-Lm8-n1]|uniref:Uncharacterized protein n=1 Tax=Suillus luteus UH-Slu-Lm8-n1 TaxID=930992 RepID=A0A0D0AUX6_9AGAM|nr:hypothetical protein CY34DRAFT_406072 [Suillus luteus UH-Slu-Lm8-n1]